MSTAAVAEIAIHGLNMTHAATSDRIKLRQKPKPIEVDIAEVTPLCVGEDNMEDFQFGGEPEVCAVDELIDELKEEFNVDTEEELGNILVIESVMKS
jgi:hypothetical protein